MDIQVLDRIVWKSDVTERKIKLDDSHTQSEISDYLKTYLRIVKQLNKRILWLENERIQLEKELRYWQGISSSSRRL